MKNYVIWANKINDFYILWLWKFCFIFCVNVEDKRKIGLWKAKRARLFFVGKYGIGIGY